MRYELDANGYVLAVYFGCYSGTGQCAEYTGTIPNGYTDLNDWSENALINAYYIYENGNLVLDVERLKELFGNLSISFRFAMKHYWENVKSEGIVFWIYFNILTITLILCCYGGYHYFSKLLGF